MDLSDFPTTAYPLMVSRTLSLHTADTAHAAWTLPSFQQFCPIALLPLTPENLRQLCG